MAEEFATGFEGCEKKLEIDFDGKADLRLIGLGEWKNILEEAKVSIVSQKHYDGFSSYILSDFQSTLFVFPRKIMLKTRGTTSILSCLSSLLKGCHDVGTEVELLSFSRSNFMFPVKEPDGSTNRSFANEVKLLNTFFKNGNAYVLGPINGARWHLYLADMNDGTGGTVKPQNEGEQTFEIVMFDLDEDVMYKFYHTREEKDGFPSSGNEATKNAGIDKLIPGSDIDSHLFRPYGYACNGCKEGSYFTVHINPDPSCSFVSFDTNIPLKDYSALIRHLVDTFKPGSFALSLFVDETASVSDSFSIAETKFDGFKSKGSTFHKFEGRYNVTCAQFVALETGTQKHPRFGENAYKERVPKEALEAILSQGCPVVSHKTSMGMTTAMLNKIAVMAVKEKFDVRRIGSQDDSRAIAEIIENESPEEAFFLVDIDEMVLRYKQWCQWFPRIEPYYGVNCNGNAGVIRVLNAIGCGFICSSVAEIKTALDQGVKPSRIMFTTPWQQPSQLKYAREKKVNLVTFHSISTLEKIHKSNPNASLLLQLSGTKLMETQARREQRQRKRQLLASLTKDSVSVTGAAHVSVTGSDSLLHDDGGDADDLAGSPASASPIASPGTNLMLDPSPSDTPNPPLSMKETVAGKKLGCALKDVKPLLNAAKRLNTKVVGVSVMLPPNAKFRTLDEFKVGLHGCRYVMDQAKKILGKELSIVDIGGGFAWDEDEIMEAKNPAANIHEPPNMAPSAAPAFTATSTSQDGPSGPVTSIMLTSIPPSASSSSAATTTVGTNSSSTAGSALDTPPTAGGASGIVRQPSQTLSSIAAELNREINRFFPKSVRLLARPSRFLLASSHTLAVTVIARREVTVGPEEGGNSPTSASPRTSPRLSVKAVRDFSDNHQADQNGHSPPDSPHLHSMSAAPDAVSMGSPSRAYGERLPPPIPDQLDLILDELIPETTQPDVDEEEMRARLGKELGMDMTTEQAVAEIEKQELHLLDLRQQPNSAPGTVDGSPHPAPLVPGAMSQHGGGGSSQRDSSPAAEPRLNSPSLEMDRDKHHQLPVAAVVSGPTKFHTTISPPSAPTTAPGGSTQSSATGGGAASASSSTSHSTASATAANGSTSSSSKKPQADTDTDKTKHSASEARKSEGLKAVYRAPEEDDVVVAPEEENDAEAEKEQDTKEVRVDRPRTFSLSSVNDRAFLYYMNDGLYGSFNCLLYDKRKLQPQVVRSHGKKPDARSDHLYPCTIFGPTCDCVDVIAEREYLPELEVGDWLCFYDMGAYTLSAATAFNGFDPPGVRFITHTNDDALDH